MKLFMVLSSIHFARKDNETSMTRWAVSLFTFYVNAVDGPHAREMADSILKAGRENDSNFVGTSGSVIPYDENGNPIESFYFSWSDI